MKVIELPNGWQLLRLERKADIYEREDGREFRVEYWEALARSPKGEEMTMISEKREEVIMNMINSIHTNFHVQ